MTNDNYKPPIIAQTLVKIFTAEIASGTVWNQ